MEKNKEQKMTDLKRKLRLMEEQSYRAQREYKSMEETLTGLTQLKHESRRLYDDIIAYWGNSHIGKLAQKTAEEKERDLRKAIQSLEHDMGKKQAEVRDYRKKEDEYNWAINRERRSV